MGLFADRCESLIDPRTGDALTGAALEAAVQDPKTPRCGNRVPKAARVCTKCGHAAPGGWWKCHLHPGVRQAAKPAKLETLAGARVAVVAMGAVGALEVAMWFLRPGTSSTLDPAPQTVSLGAMNPAQGYTKSVALEKQRFPDLKGPWENSLGMKFAPVGGTEALFCVWETRVQDFRAFVSDRAGNSGYDYRQGDDPYVLKADGWKQRGSEYGWNNPGFRQGDDYPVTCVSYDDATKFCAWLTAKERKAGTIGMDQAYRLPRDWEWSVAVGLNEPKGGTPKDKDAKAPGYPWGSGEKPPARWGNYGGEESRTSNTPSAWSVIAGYDDGYARTSPAGAFGAKHGDLCDLGGNVWEWCEDWYDSNQMARVLRGGSWDDRGPGDLLSSSRSRDPPGSRVGNGGVRVVLSSSSP